MGKRGKRSSDRGGKGSRRERETSPDGVTYMCGTCEKAVSEGQRALECGLCSVRYHAACEQVGKKEYTGLKMSGKAGEYFCSQCNGQFASLKCTNTMLREENEALKKENERLMNHHKIMEYRVKQLELSVEDIRDKVTKREEIERNMMNNIAKLNLPEIECENEGCKKDREVAMGSDLINNEIETPQAEIQQVIPLGSPREGNAHHTQPQPQLIKGGVAAVVGGGVAGLSASVLAEQPSVVALVAEADQLYEQMKYDEICALLSPYQDTKSDEILWRLGRATYEQAKAAASKEEQRRLFRKALDHVEAALAINSENFAVHKWLSILIDFVYAAEGTKARLSKAYVVKEHMIKACQLNPSDATSRHLLGYWFFSFANVPWYQRKIASVLFTTPPSGTFEEALENFLLAEKLEPNFYSKNLLMIGKSYLMLGKKPEAKEYLQRTLSYPAKTEDDRESVAEAETLIKGL